MAEEKKKATPVKNTNAVNQEEKETLVFSSASEKWFRELKSELKKKVVWPTRKQTLARPTPCSTFSLWRLPPSFL